MLPLTGIRVIDLGSVAMAPYAGQWLGDLGADVIKVETPEGDSTRRTGPAPERDMASMFMALNRNKRSIVLDLKQPEAVAALHKLVDDSDVLLHNIRPQKLTKLGLDSATLRERNPRLIYAGFHGFDKTGPYGGRAAYDDIIQGLSGSTDILGRQSGQAQYFPSIVADKTSGLIGAIAILAAIVSRERTGVGGQVEIPMFEAMTAFNLVEHFYGAHFPSSDAGMGYPRVMASSRRPFATTDGSICMLPYTDAQWRAFFREVGEPQLADDPRFIDIGKRTENSLELYAIAGRFIAQRSTGTWLEICENLSIPAAPMLRLEMLPNDPHLQAVRFFATLRDPSMGNIHFPGIPLKFDGERPPISFPPRLGEHGRDILDELGLPNDAPWACPAKTPTSRVRTH